MKNFTEEVKEKFPVGLSYEIIKITNLAALSVIKNFNVSIISDYLFY